MNGQRASRTSTTSKGFTIVELLIVIVVIAILAAITIVSYNGITARATETQIVTEAKQAVTLLKAFYAENGRYPTITNGQNSVCVGEGFTNYVGTSYGDCWDTRSSVYRSVDPNFNAELETVGRLNSSNKPSIYYQASPAVSFTGPVFVTPSETSQSVSYYGVRYWVLGTTCPVGNKTWSGAVTVTSGCTIPLD